jgi:hypothetical protein
MRPIGNCSNGLLNVVDLDHDPRLTPPEEGGAMSPGGAPTAKKKLEIPNKLKGLSTKNPSGTMHG